MDYGQIIIGVMIGVLLGAIGMWLLDRRHQKVIRKLVDSRRKLERQRTQAVNDLFALRAEVEDPNFRPPNAPAMASGPSAPDPRAAAEMANLRSLISRADGALTVARRKRDQHEAEIKRLRALLEAQSNPNVIDLRPQDRPAGMGGGGGLAL